MKKGRIAVFFIVVALLAALAVGTIRPILQNINLGLDLQGGFEVLYQVTPKDEEQTITDETMVATTQALDRRINVLGVSEPSIQIEGQDRIRVQLAGVTDQENAREILSTQGELSFRDVNDELLLDGTDLAENGASQTFDQQNQPAVALELKDADKFAEATQHIVNMAPQNQMVIWLDYEEGDSFEEEYQKHRDPNQESKILSVANVDQVFRQPEVSITGNFEVEEAKELADLLNSGSLPVALEELHLTSVGAQFGQEALEQTVFAGYVAIIAIFLFMIFYYRLPGIISVVTLSFYIYLILLVFQQLNAVLTLPGIAALILGVGMAVDANIISAERIKDEIQSGKSIRSAFRAGNRRSIGTIFDANITTLLAASVLFIFGTSSVKGFATMLIISILVSFITAVYGSRFLLSLWVNSGLFKNKPGWFGVKRSDIDNLHEVEDESKRRLKGPYRKVNFVKHRKFFFIGTGVLLLVGFISLFVFKFNLGIDFASGTRIDLIAQEPLTEESVNNEFSSIGLAAPDELLIDGENSKRATASYVGALSEEESQIVKAHFQETYGTDPSISTVSPIVGKELTKNAIFALIIASIGMVIYVAIRFEIFFGLAAILALLHDAFFIIVVFSIFQIELDINFIAAILTIIGYSINDTIVTFDRIRENMGYEKKIRTREDLERVVNRSLVQTMTRSLNTIITVIIGVLALLIFGNESISTFSIALLIGLIAGTYSSICLASQLWLTWKIKQLEKQPKGQLDPSQTDV
ncbi:protein translocase subunit SecDF [Aureibacillus halotolerans]|uniref:Multifunctional fusion protein n=1 Tax=Aureibacillus halotolerans TaxID=1508390 RepID=A0A4R6U0T0_9BACI|nr:protein translocase subunit SecDF [Aureibacillus halotolerans]TDQ37989.1 protein translocase subunit secF /protein translocase subunit secD [Aureibacillus halotolerans]